MKLSSKFLLVIFIMIFCSVSIFAANQTGTSAAPFLKIEVGGRPNAMAGCNVGLGEDLFGVYYNPASITYIKNKSFAFQHNEWLEDIKQEFFAGAYALNEKNTIGLNITFLNMGDITRTLETAGGGYAGTDGTFSADDLALGFNYGYDAGNIKIGATLKYVKQTNAGYSDNALAIDLGLMGYYIDKKYRYGISISNIGNKIQLYQKEYELPMILRIGASTKFRKLVVALDLVKPDDNDLSIRTGLEYIAMEMLSLRLGYKTEDDLSNGFTLGAGFKISSMKIDYAFQPKDEFGDAHMISFIYDF